MDNSTTRKASYVILISLGLAVVFNGLFFGKLVGISVLIFTGVLLGSVFLFGHYNQISLKKSWWVACLVVFFSLMVFVSANEFLSFLNIVATFGLLMLLAHQIAGTPVFLMKIRDYLTLALLVPFRMLRKALSTISFVSQVHSTVQHRDVWIRIFKGVVMAVPILVIFGALFSQADLAFSQFISSFVNITISETEIQYLVLLAFAFVAGLSFLSYIFFPKEIETVVVPEQSTLEAVRVSKGIEVTVFLGLISTLFLVFIVFQITYLFGGETNIVNAGFTYAEYARRGFWELLAVAMLSLVVLVASEKYAGVEASAKRNLQFLVPALVLIGEVVIVIVSAFKRLSLYIDTYGMTILRFYVGVFIILLLVLFVILAIKFIQTKREQFFVFGTLLSVLTFLAVINIVNPDVLIIKANIQQYQETGKIDVYYVSDLSADAVAGKIDLYNKLAGEDKEILKGSLLVQKTNLENWKGDWQSANLSRSKALTLLKASSIEAEEVK